MEEWNQMSLAFLQSNSLASDFLLNLAASLAYDLLKTLSIRLRNAAFGDEECLALKRAYENAFKTMLLSASGKVEHEITNHVESILRAFVSDGETADMLLDIVLQAEESDPSRLRVYFEAKGFDPTTFPIDFDAAMAAFLYGLFEGLQQEAMQPGSPLYNRVSLSGIHAVLRGIKQMMHRLDMVADRQPLGAPFQAPPLPFYFVPRSNEYDPIKSLLTAPAASAIPGALFVVALYGMGGIGKSVVTAALAHDVDIQKALPDGVLWIVLGQQPELFARLYECIQALGDRSWVPATIEGGVAHLRSLLHSRSCLIVIDDAWQADHVRPFLVGGSGCKVVVTTRNATLGHKIGAHLHNIEVMTKVQALSLFERRLGPLGRDREIAASLAHDLGYLPLALELASAQINAGTPWSDLQDSFRQGLARLKTLELDEASFRNESVRLSFRLSLDQLSSEDLDAFAWFGVLPDDVKIGPGTVATLWNQEQIQARRRLHRFRDKSLVRTIGSDQYIIHDLLHEEAKLQLVERMSLTEAHTSLLARYRTLTKQASLWHTLPDDGYIHSHLAWHLQQARQEAELHDLLAEQTVEGRNGWYKVREQLGQYAGYLDDIARARHIAIRSEALSLQVRYALIESTIHTLAEQLPIQLLRALLEYGGELMPPTTVLERIKQLPRVWQRADALHDLAPYIPLELLPDALDLAIGLARENERGLVGLGPHLPADLLQVALRRLPTESRSAGQYLFFQAVAPNLPNQLLELGLDTARRLGEAGCRAVALSCLLPHLQDDLLFTVIEEILEALYHPISDSTLRARALFYLAPYLTADQIRKTWQISRTGGSLSMDQVSYGMACPWLTQAYLQAGMLDEMFDLFKHTSLDDYLFEAIKHIAPKLPKDLLPKLLEYLPISPRGFEQPKALGVLVEYGSIELQRKALALARTDRYDSACKLIALAVIAPHLQEQSVQAEVLKELRQVLYKCSKSVDGWNRWSIAAYREVVSQLPPNLVSAVVQETRSPWSWPVIALESLEKLPCAQRKTVCAELLMLAREGDLHWDMLTKLTPHITPQEREHLLTLAMEQAKFINDQDEHDPLAPYRASASGVWPERSDHDYFREDDHVRVLLAMIPHSSRKEQAIQLALEALSALGHKLVDIRPEEILSWWPFLDDEQQAFVSARVPIALDLSPQRREAQWHVEAVLNLWYRLFVRLTSRESKELLANLVQLKAQQALPQALRVLLLSLVVHDLNRPHSTVAEKEISRWLENNAVKAKQDDHQPFQSFFDQVLHTLKQAEDYDILHSGASFLFQPQILTETLRQFSRRIEYHKDRPDVLIPLAAVWAHLPPSDLYQVFQTVLPILAVGDRRQFLWDLHAIAPVVLKLGGEKAMQVTIEEVERVKGWWT